MGDGIEERQLEGQPSFLLILFLGCWMICFVPKVILHPVFRRCWGCLLNILEGLRALADTVSTADDEISRYKLGTCKVKAKRLSLRI